MVGGISQLSDDVYVAGQISVEDIPALVEAGFKSVINNRPDDEVCPQPSSIDVGLAAKGAGMEYLYIPMSGAQLTAETIEKSVEAFRELPKPILAHCAGGPRSALLWAFSNVKADGVDSVLATTASAGFTFEQFRPMLEQYAQD